MCSIQYRFRFFDWWSASGPTWSREMDVIEMNNNNIDPYEQHLRELTKTFMGIEKPLKNAKTVNSLKDLCDELHRVFESNHVNIEYVNHLMLSYKSNPSDWKKFAKFDRYRQVYNICFIVYLVINSACYFRKYSFANHKIYLFASFQWELKRSLLQINKIQSIFIHFNLFQFCCLYVFTFKCWFG